MSEHLLLPAAVKERPMIFTGPSVHGIRSGVKTQTRRVVTVPWRGSRRALPYEPYWDGSMGDGLKFCDEYGDWHPAEETLGSWRVGDRIWVREAFKVVSRHAYRASTDDGGLTQLPHTLSPDGRDWAIYREGWTRSEPKPWTSPIYMPRWASRLLLELTQVRIEKLQQITEEDARAEGMDNIRAKVPRCRDAYAMTWDAIHARDKTGRSWADSPWVWALSFRLVEAEKAAAVG